MHSYFTIQPIEEILYKDKASKFIGFAYPVKDEKEIKEKLDPKKIKIGFAKEYFGEGLNEEMNPTALPASRF